MLNEPSPTLATKETCKKVILSISTFVVSFCTGSYGQIIDMHMHVYSEKEYWGGDKHLMGSESPNNVEEHFNQTIALMDSHKIEYALISGSPEVIRKWKERDNRFIGGYEYINNELIDTTEFINLIEEGVIQAWAEMGSVFKGETLDDPKFEPYIKICEQYGIPIGYHTGTTNPWRAYSGRFRVTNSDPMKIEEVHAKYPKLKIYLMHAGGGSFTNNTIEMMYQYPHLYVDIGVLLWVDYKPKYQVIQFLKLAKEARMLDRVMFGSDQMVWPEAITHSIEYLNSFDFLTDDEKHMIFYSNAKKIVA